MNRRFSTWPQEDERRQQEEARFREQEASKSLRCGLYPPGCILNITKSQEMPRYNAEGMSNIVKRFGFSRHGKRQLLCNTFKGPTPSPLKEAQQRWLEEQAEAQRQEAARQEDWMGSKLGMDAELNTEVLPPELWDPNDHVHLYRHTYYSHSILNQQ